MTSLGKTENLKYPEHALGTGKNLLDYAFYRDIPISSRAATYTVSSSSQGRRRLRQAPRVRTQDSAPAAAAARRLSSAGWPLPSSAAFPGSKHILSTILTEYQRTEREPIRVKPMFDWTDLPVDRSLAPEGRSRTGRLRVIWNREL